MRIDLKSTALLLAGLGSLLGPSCGASEYLQPEKTYHTKCLGLYETLVPDGRTVYHSNGLPKSNDFTRLDVLSGACGKVAPLPAVEFQPRAVSADYIFARDGIYNRHSVYRKSDWKRTGTLRLKDGVVVAALRGDTLYLVQQDYAGDRRFYLDRFSLPQMSLQATQALELKGERVFAFGHSLLFADPGKLAVYDYETGAVRRADFPVSLDGVEMLPDGQTAQIGCGSDAKLLGEDAVMTHTSCHSYAVYDLATLKPRYEIPLSDKAIFAKGFVSGSLLYLLAESTTVPRNYSGGVHDDVRVVDYRTGRPVAALPPLVSNNYTYVFQVEDRLVWAAFDSGASDFSVTVYRMRSAPLP